MTSRSTLIIDASCDQGAGKIGRVCYKSGLRDFRLLSTSFRRILLFVIFDINIVLSMKEMSEESGLSPAISR